MNALLENGFKQLQYIPCMKLLNIVIGEIILLIDFEFSGDRITQVLSPEIHSL